MQARGAAP